MQIATRNGEQFSRTNEETSDSNDELLQVLDVLEN